MDKRKINLNEKIVSKAGLVIGTIGILGGIVSAISYKKKTQKLEQDIYGVADCHNAFCMYQQEKNREFEERLDEQEDEIVTTMEHLQYFIETM